MKIKEIKQIVSFHDAYWEKKRQEMRRYKAAYETNFWEEQGTINDWSNTQITIQVSEGYAYIESFIASLYAKHPNVVLKTGLENKGAIKKSQFIANEFLERSRREIESASRMALIYTHSFIKLVPQDTGNLLQKVLPVSIPPWEIILDYDAPRWDLQKYVGHIYYLTVAEADEKFGSKDWLPMSKYSTEYFNRGRDSVDIREEPQSAYEYVQIVEMYDLVEDRLIFYSPSWKEDKILMAEKVAIPFRTYDGKPSPPIAPFYFNRIPDAPLEGYSAMKRIYDQIFEMNIIRSYQANAVRKASRQYLVKKGSLDSEQMAQITAGIDGIFVEIEDENLDGVIKALPQNPTPPELQMYYQMVSGDKDKGSIMAPFTRGEATKVTAAETAALAAYTSSEIGRLARERDAVIENMVKLYLSILGLYLAEGEKQLVYIDGRMDVVSTEDVVGDFNVYAADSSSTPISEAINRGQLLANIPTLTALGVPKELILNELVKVLNLPETFKAEAIKEQMMKEQANVPAATPPQVPPSPMEAVMNPSTRNIGPLLPNTGVVR